MDKVKSYIEKNKDRFLNELFELLRIPSISAQSDQVSQAVWGIVAEDIRQPFCRRVFRTYINMSGHYYSAPDYMVCL